MLRTRVIPCLLLKDGGLHKSVKFKLPASSYVGDPINAVRIYNEKEVDELLFVDITATVEGREPGFKLAEEIASECFMPVAFGGGIREIDHVRQLFTLGIEKVVVNSYALERPEFITEVARYAGSQSLVVSIDVKKSFFGKYKVFGRGGRQRTGRDPVDWAREVERLGAGEILLTSMDRDGTGQGYDLELLGQVTRAVRIPVIACGGAGTVEHFGQAVREGGASAVAAGSMVVYYGRNRAVLINFPERSALESVLG
ncbi:MAG: imidazole glycerol phosphate synthase subunit HisF [Candidatus Xenobia bacterium]